MSMLRSILVHVSLAFLSLIKSHKYIPFAAAAAIVHLSPQLLHLCGQTDLNSCFTTEHRTQCAQWNIIMTKTLRIVTLMDIHRGIARLDMYSIPA